MATARLTIIIDIVEDDTTDVADLLRDIDGRPGFLQVAGYAFDVTRLTVETQV